MNPQELTILNSGRLQDIFLWLWLWLVRRHKRFHVTDRSMLPLLHPGDEVLVNRGAYTDTSPQLNDIVVFDHPQQPGFRLVKRVRKVSSDVMFSTSFADAHTTFEARTRSEYWVEGDNTSVSTDSRSFGPVPHHCLIGKGVYIFRENIGRENMGRENMGRENMGRENMGRENMGRENMGRES